MWRQLFSKPIQLFSKFPILPGFGARSLLRHTNTLSGYINVRTHPPPPCPLAPHPAPPSPHLARHTHPPPCPPPHHPTRPATAPPYRPTLPATKKLAAICFSASVPARGAALRLLAWRTTQRARLCNLRMCVGGCKVMHNDNTFSSRGHRSVVFCM